MTEPFLWLQNEESEGVSDDGHVRLVQDLECSGNAAVFLSGPYAVAPQLLKLLKYALHNEGDWKTDAVCKKARAIIDKVEE
jgi:hypothetical protein